MVSSRQNESRWRVHYCHMDQGLGASLVTIGQA